MKLSRMVAWNAVTTLVVESLNVVLQFWLVRFLIDRLGADYGLVPLLTSAVAFSLMADVGLRRALSRHLAAQFALDDPTRGNRFFSTALCCFLAVGGLLMLFCVIGGPWLADLARIQGPLRPQAVWLIRWFVGPMILLSFVSPAYKSVLIALNRFDVINATRLVEVGSRLTLIFGLLSWTSAGVYGWAGAMLASLAIDILANAIYAHRLWPRLRFRPRLFERAALLELFHLGGVSLLYENASRIGIATHPWVIARYVGAGANIAYDPARQMVLAIDVLVGAVTRQVLPIATSFHVQGQEDRLRDLLTRGTRFTLLLGAPLCVLLSCYAEPLLRTWQSPKFLPHLPAAVAALSFWCAINLLKYVGGTQYQVLFGMHRVWFISILEFGLSILNLAASIMLTAALAGRLGEGAVVGVLFPTLVCSLIARAINSVQVARVVGLPPSRYVREAYARPVGVIIAFLGLTYGVVWLIPPLSISTLLMSVSVACVAFLPLGWWLGMDARDRETIADLARRMPRTGAEQAPVDAPTPAEV